MHHSSGSSGVVYVDPDREPLFQSGHVAKAEKDATDFYDQAVI